MKKLFLSFCITLLLIGAGVYSIQAQTSCGSYSACVKAAKSRRDRCIKISPNTAWVCWNKYNADVNRCKKDCPDAPQPEDPPESFVDMFLRWFGIMPQMVSLDDSHLCNPDGDLGLPIRAKATVG